MERNPSKESSLEVIKESISTAKLWIERFRAFSV